MSIEKILYNVVKDCISDLYSGKVDDIQFQRTRSEFDGDITLVVFPILRKSKKTPEETAEDIGRYLKDNLDIIDTYNIVKGFLNLTISPEFWFAFNSFS